MATIRRRLFQWKGSEVTITALLDDTDFVSVTDSFGTTRSRRVLGIEVDGNMMRANSIRTLKGRTVIDEANLPDTLLRTRIYTTGPYEHEMGWDFTPAHVDVKRGSVSVPSLLTSGGNAIASASDTTAAFTPTADALLIASWSAQVGTVPTFGFTNTHAGSGAWTQVTVATAADSSRHSQAYSQVGAAPGSGTITNTYTGNQPVRKSWIIFETTGHDPPAPVSESITGTVGADTVLSVSVADVGGANLVISSMTVVGQAAVTVGTGETELAEATSGGASETRTQVQYSTNTAHDWAWSTANEAAGVAIEYAELVVLPARASMRTHIASQAIRTATR